jgi:hypothetical protein
MSAGITSTPGIKTPGNYINEIMALVKAKNPAEPEFHQAVQEVFESLRLVLEKHPEYISAKHSGAHHRTGAPHHVPRAVV